MQPQHEVRPRTSGRGRDFRKTPLYGALGCIGNIGAVALIAWIAWTFTIAHAAVLGEHHLFWVIGAAIGANLGATAIWKSLQPNQDAQLVRRARRGKPYVDGRRNAFIGTVRSGSGAPLPAPVTGTPTALFRYEILRPPEERRTRYESPPKVLYQGRQMRTPLITTRQARARIVSFPRLVRFPNELIRDAAQIEAFVDATSFELKDQEQLASETSEDYISEAGTIDRNDQLSERPESFEGLVLETTFVPDGAEAAVIATWDEASGTLGSGEFLRMYNTADSIGRKLLGTGARGYSFVLGWLLLIASLIILAGPVLPAQRLLLIPGVGSTLLQERASAVSSHIETGDVESARRLSGLGLAGTSVDALPSDRLALDDVALLIANGANPDSTDSGGNTLLMKAEDPLLVERLLARGASADRRNGEGRTAAEEALARWRFGVATRLLTPAGVGHPLADAIRKRDHAELARLLASGADPGATIDLGGRPVSPLYYAAAFGNLEAVDRLLANGAVLESGDAPPLLGAVESRSLEVAERLIDAGAEVAMYESNPRIDPLNRAVELEQPEMVRVLVSRGAGRSPVYHDLFDRTDDPELVGMVRAVIDESE